MDETVDWLEPWRPVEAGEGLGGRLALETPPGHVLFGQTVRTIARREDADDVLFGLADGRVAQVHLTWSATPGTDPRFPATTIYLSLPDWARDAMGPQHREWAE